MLKNLLGIRPHFRLPAFPWNEKGPDLLRRGVLLQGILGVYQNQVPRIDLFPVRARKRLYRKLCSLSRPQRARNRSGN